MQSSQSCVHNLPFFALLKFFKVVYNGAVMIEESVEMKREKLGLLNGQQVTERIAPRSLTPHQAGRNRLNPAMRPTLVRLFLFSSRCDDIRSGGGGDSLSEARRPFGNPGPLLG